MAIKPISAIGSGQPLLVGRLLRAGYTAAPTAPSDDFHGLGALWGARPGDRRVEPIPPLGYTTSGAAGESPGEARDDRAAQGDEAENGFGRGAAHAVIVPGIKAPVSSPDRRAASAVISTDARDRGLSREELQNRMGELEAEKARKEQQHASVMNERSLQTAQILAQLRARDAHVRAHEAAHMAAGGSYIRGGATYIFEKGPDGGEYAVGGEVSIDASPIPGKPAETAAKMAIVRAAALAPSDPSPADNAIAAAASEMEAEAYAELAAQQVAAAAQSYGTESAKGVEGANGGAASTAVAAPAPDTRRAPQAGPSMGMAKPSAAGAPPTASAEGPAAPRTGSVAGTAHHPARGRPSAPGSTINLVA